MFVTVFAATTLQLAGQIAASGAKQVPTFQVDASWPQLPNNWGMGVVSSVAVDQRDHVWILHRPRVGVPAGKMPAPAVLEFDDKGQYVQGWGGPADGFEWPDSEHGIYVDDKDSVWIGGSSRKGAAVCQGGTCSRGDDMLLKFTTKGKFIRAIGKRDQSTGPKDPNNVHAATDVFVYRKTNELFVSDGYEGPGQQGNCRVVVFDSETGAFKRFWGAFGKAPECDPNSPQRREAGGRGRGAAAAPSVPAAPAAPAAASNAEAQTRGGGRGRGQQEPLETEGPGSQQFSIVHGIEISNDGQVYVADRQHRRIQVFDLSGKYLTQVFVNRSGPADASAAGLAFSPDRDQRFMYVADFGNSRVVVVDRRTLDVLDQFGERSAKPGDFQGIHNIAVDSKGNLYTAEVAPGNRAQRFVFKGLAALPAVR
jgi:hypothetical protein